MMDKIKLPIVMILVALGVCFYLVAKIVSNDMRAIELVQNELAVGEHGLEPRPEEVQKRDTAKLTPEIEMGDGVTEYREMDDIEWCRDWLVKHEDWESKAAFEEALGFYDDQIEDHQGALNLWQDDYDKCVRRMKAAEEANMSKDSKYMEHLQADCEATFRIYEKKEAKRDSWIKDKADFVKSFKKGLEAQS